jgi:hypothetical protein
MQNQLPADPELARSGSTGYIALWAVLALASFGYIVWLASNPDRIAAQRGSVPQTTGETNEGQRAMTDALAEMKALKEAVGEVQRDVAQLKTDVSGTVERNMQLVDRVAALETSAAAQRVAAANPATTTVAPSATPAAPAVKASEKSRDVKPSAAAAAPKVISAPPATPVKPLETGSVAAPATAAKADAAPVVFGPAVVKPTAKPFGIQVATGPSVDSLRLSWSLLSDRHASTLKSLQPRYISGEGLDGPSFDLVAGPVASAAEAKKLCAELETQLVPCKVGEYSGDAL